jgi:hypothetical protein
MHAAGKPTAHGLKSGAPIGRLAFTTTPEIFDPAKALKTKHYRPGGKMHEIIGATVNVLLYSAKAGVRH